MTNFIAEFKIAELTTDGYNRWEDTFIAYTRYCSDVETANSIARDMSREYRRPIRWNVKGLYQGHYITDYKD